LSLDVRVARRYGDVALGVLTQTTPPSWGAWIANDNATTLFEMWGAFDGEHARGTASRNHVMFSTFMPWLYQTLVGIAMDKEDFGVGVLLPAQTGGAQSTPAVPTGYSSFRVAPRLLGDLSAASATVVTMRGDVSVSWARSAATVWLNVTLPLGADTAVTVPLPRGQGCDPGKTTVWEGAALVWQRGRYVPGVLGISGAQPAPTAGPLGLGGVQVTTGSGAFAFVASC